MEENRNNIDTRLEQKLGFDRIRKAVADRCATEYAVNRTMEETFSKDAGTIRERLLLTDEMRLILMFEESFPSGGYIDCIGFLKLLERPASYINLVSLRKLRTMLETVKKISVFFSSLKDGIYPCLKRMAGPVLYFPEVLSRIDALLDRFGEIRDSASEELASIRRALKDTEGTISRRAGSILRKMQEDGLADKDASVSVRDGSGLSRHNLLSPSFICSFLQAMTESPEFDNFTHTLSSPGSTGTMQSVMPEYDRSLTARIKLKSGSMSGVKCFSGYIFPENGGQPIVFSIMINNTLLSQYRLQKITDRLIYLIALAS